MLLAVLVALLLAAVLVFACSPWRSAPMLVASVPVLMIVLGALVYALSANPKMVELGRLCAFAGLIGVAVATASKLITLGH